jgi:histidine decarboxylase
MCPHKLDKSEHAKLDALFEQLTTQSKTHLGYPCNLNYDYSELHRFLTFSINNIGDPFSSSNYKVNTHRFEREVLDFFSTLLEAKADYRGYVTNGGTEGNLYGLYLARSRFPSGIVYFTEQAHYSIYKIVNLLNIEHKIIPANERGEMDYSALSKHLNRHKPAIILANIGSTMTGAVDDIKAIKTCLKAHHKHQHYIHCDAAFHGAILPLLDTPFGFSQGFDSIAISGHKMIGSPIPCGVVLTTYEAWQGLTDYVEYVDVLDSTISGSRNGFTPLVLWYAIKTLGKDGLHELVTRSINRADYAIKQLKTKKITAWRNPNSPIVIFPTPSDRLCKKWQLASHGPITHLITTDNVDNATIDKFVSEIASDPEVHLSKTKTPQSDKKPVKKHIILKSGVLVAITVASAIGVIESAFD